MRIEALHDRDLIESFLRRDAAAHVYAIADLDEPHWSHARWFGAFAGERLVGLCLLLDGLSMPILYALCPAGDPVTAELLRSLDGALPDRFFYNLGPGLTAALERFRLAPEGRYWKMVLTDAGACEAVEGHDVERLGPEHLRELERFLGKEAYRPDETGGLFFDARMLETGCYRGIREGGRLTCVGGVHVRSRRLRVAAMGNVVTRPDARGRGLARRVSAAVVRGLLPDEGIVGLNVHEENRPARRCYERLGFTPVCPYEEGVAVRASRAR